MQAELYHQWEALAAQRLSSLLSVILSHGFESPGDLAEALEVALAEIAGREPDRSTCANSAKPATRIEIVIPHDSDAPSRLSALRRALGGDSGIPLVDLHPLLAQIDRQMVYVLREVA